MYSVTHKRKIAIQVGCAAVDREEAGVQCSHSSGSYGCRQNETEILTYDEVLRNYLWTKDYTIEWRREEKHLARVGSCEICQCDVKLRECSDRSDGYIWECRRQIGR